MTKQICGTCNGTGWVYPERAGAKGGKGGSVPSQEVCPTCNGVGWLDGLTR
jgi:DnaJ-class molecular chaperone